MQLLLILLFSLISLISLISLFLLFAHEGGAPGDRDFGVLIGMVRFLRVIPLRIRCLCFSTPGRVGYLLDIARLVVLCFRRFIHYSPFRSLKIAHNSTKSTRVDLHVV